MIESVEKSIRDFCKWHESIEPRYTDRQLDVRGFFFFNHRSIRLLGVFQASVDYSIGSKSALIVFANATLVKLG